MPFSVAVKDVTSEYSKLQKSEYLEQGKFPIVDQGQQKFGGYTDDDSVVSLSGYPAIVFGDHTRIFKFIDEPFCLGADGVKVLEPKVELDRKFLFYYFSSLTIESAGYSRHFKFLKENVVPVPSLVEQKRIAAILDKAEAIRRKRQQAIELVDDFLRAVFEDMFGDPVNNPKGFPIGTIRDLVATADYGTSAKASEAYGEYPILRMGNVTYQGRIDLKDLKYIDLEGKDQSKYLARKGDLLFNRTNSKELVGKAAVYDMDDPVAIAGYLIRVRPNERGNSYYIAGYLNSAHGKATLKSVCKSIVGMANINAQEMQNIPIMLPPAEMQRRYQELVVATRCRLIRINSSLKVVEELFSSLSHKCLSGQI
nr:restriction endonuclease subunit S [Pantoea sp. Cy-639]